MAADILDESVELQALLNHSALRDTLSKQRFHLPSRTICKDCDGEIPPARQALGGVERCTECEGFYQQEQRQKGFGYAG